MPCSHLEQLWEGDQDLPNLKSLILSNSNKLLQVPDLSHSPNIEEIFLSHCVRLVQVYSSSFLGKLNCLCLDGCHELKSVNLPSNILSRSSGLVVLSDCCKLETCSFGSTREKEDKAVQFPPYYGCSRFDRFHQTTKSWKCNADGYWVGEYYSQSIDPIPSADSHDPKPRDDIHLRNIKDILNTIIMPSISTTLNELCWLDFSNCSSLTSLPTQIFKLKLLRRLYLGGCCNLEELPEIEEPMENLTVLILNKTSIKELPSSLHLLVGLEELSLYDCQNLEIIPSSIGSLTKLCKLRLTCCESLKNFPSSIFKLKQLKGLDFHGCSMLRTFPEILEPAENFAHINLTKTTIKELPSSLEYLVGLQTLRLKLCTQLVSLQNNIANLDLLSKIDCSGCTSLKEIPYNIGRLSLLRELSLQESSIVNLPESIAHLTSLKTLDISDCKSLQCIPQLPPFLDQLVAFDCPSIRRVLLLPQNSISRVPDDNSEEGTSTNFRFYFTNSTQGLDCSSSIGAEAWFRINQYAYRSVIFCFPGHGVPDWFPYRCKGHEITMKTDCHNNMRRPIGFALCVVLGAHQHHTVLTNLGDVRLRFRYRLTFESNGRTYTLSENELKNHFYWKGEDRFVVQDHIFIWKYNFASNDKRLVDAKNFMFEISKYYSLHHSKSTVKVKECGICPLYYTSEKDDDDDDRGINIKEPSSSVIKDYENSGGINIKEPSSSSTGIKYEDENDGIVNIDEPSSSEIKDGKEEGLWNWFVHKVEEAENFLVDSWSSWTS